MVDGDDRKGDFVGSMADAQAELISMRGPGTVHPILTKSGIQPCLAQPSSRATMRKSCVQPAVVAARVSSQLRVAPSAALPLLEGC